MSGCAAVVCTCPLDIVRTRRAAVAEEALCDCLHNMRRGGGALGFCVRGAKADLRSTEGEVMVVEGVA